MPQFGGDGLDGGGSVAAINTQTQCGSGVSGGDGGGGARLLEVDCVGAGAGGGGIGRGREYGGGSGRAGWQRLSDGPAAAKASAGSKSDGQHVHPSCSVDGAGQQRERLLLRYKVRTTSVRELMNVLRMRGSILDSEWLSFGGRPLREDEIIDGPMQETLNAVFVGRIQRLPRAVGGMQRAVVLDLEDARDDARDVEDPAASLPRPDESKDTGQERDKGTNGREHGEHIHDENEQESETQGERESDKNENDDSAQAENRRSHSSGFDREAGRSYFRCVKRGGVYDQTRESNRDDFRYPDNFVITDGDATIGTILRQVGQGAMGTVYEMQLSDGSICAIKSVRADVSPEQRLEHEKQLANDVAFGFAMGRSPFIMTVFRVVVSLPDKESTAKGVLLLCDFVDGGDLEEAMSTKAAVKIEKPDYKGDLWDKNATIWPVASITLQIYMAFEHCHARGVCHQVRCCHVSFV